jgi:hypothetical protein
MSFVQSLRQSGRQLHGEEHGFKARTVANIEYDTYRRQAGKHAERPEKLSEKERNTVAMLWGLHSSKQTHCIILWRERASLGLLQWQML